MPYVDYKTWYQKEQERRQRLGLPGAVGAPRQEQIYQGYQAPSNSEILKTQGAQLAQGGIRAGIGFLGGGPVGAAIAAAPAAVGMVSNAARGFKEASEAGDMESAARQIAPSTGLLSSLTGASMVLPFAAPALAAASYFMRKPKTKVEENRWKKLREAGFEVPKWVEDKSLKSDIYREDLGADFVGKTEEGNFVNNIFAKSRNEADLRPEDLIERATAYETFGQNWSDTNEETRKRIMDLALQNQIVREHKGTIDINWTPEILSQAENILSENIAAQPETQERKHYVMPDFDWSRYGNYAKGKK